MDIRLLDAEPSPAERDAIDAFLGPPVSSWTGADRLDNGHAGHGGHAARAERHQLLPTLHALHEKTGWISPGALNYIARRLTIPPADVYGVATFYALFSTEPRSPRVLHVCDDVVCRCAGSQALIDTLTEQVGPEGTDVDGASWHVSPCLGQCDRAPAALVIESGSVPVERELTEVSAEKLVDVIHGATPVAPASAVPPQAGQPGLRLLGRIGFVDPDSLDDYRAHGGYAALRRAFELGPDGVIREVLDSKLMGRGGAAFPTGRKWDAVARQPRRPHYLICNADESEPGTFKDRVMMEGDPFAVIESMTIAAYATNCEHGFLYLRGEYPLAQRRLENALQQARERQFLGENIFGQEFNFDIEVRKGAGAYICGEETAIFGSIEGYRGEPRKERPFPVRAGPVRQAHGRQQRRDARERDPDSARRRRSLCRDRHRAFDRALEAVLRRRSRCSSQAPTRCRSGRRGRELLGSRWSRSSSATACAPYCWAGWRAASSPRSNSISR